MSLFKSGFMKLMMWCFSGDGPETGGPKSSVQKIKNSHDRLKQECQGYERLILDLVNGRTQDEISSEEMRQIMIYKNIVTRYRTAARNLEQSKGKIVEAQIMKDIQEANEIVKTELELNGIDYDEVIESVQDVENVSIAHNQVFSAIQDEEDLRDDHMDAFDFNEFINSIEKQPGKHPLNTHPKKKKNSERPPLEKTNKKKKNGVSLSTASATEEELDEEPLIRH